MSKEFLRAAEQIGKLTVEALRQQYILQGHKLTGRLNRSISYKTEETTEGAKVIILMESYGVILDQGVNPNRIPFGGSTGAKSSRYIQGLAQFAKKRFRVSSKKALSIAFAIAKQHKKKGMSTPASRKYSKTGKRKGAINFSLLDTAEEATKLIEETLQQSIELFFEQFLNAQ